MALPDPIIVGGHPALDFLNTVAAPRGQAIEFIPSGAQLLGWLVRTDLIEAREERHLHRRFSSEELDAVARQAAALREWFRPIVRRSASRGSATLSRTELDRLNALLADGTSFPQLGRKGRRYVVGQERRWNEAPDLLVPIGEAMADLLCAADFRLVRKCGNPACTLWFLDATKAHRRRWCTMAICGNRAKAAAHRRRKPLSP